MRSRRGTVLSSGIQEHLLCLLHSCRHTSICSISREADTEWCTYQCQDINPAVSLSCCYQFMSCENEMVTWADHHYLHWLYTLLHSCEVISFPYFRAHFKCTDSKKRGAVAFNEACLCEFSKASCHIYNLRSVTPQHIVIMHDHLLCLSLLNHVQLTPGYDRIIPYHFKHKADQ